MTEAERIDDRLRVLDLRLDCPGDHLDEERLAEILHGGDPAREEAARQAAEEGLTALGGSGSGEEARPWEPTHV